MNHLHWIDWVVALVPLSLVFFLGWKSKKYLRSVADYLTASRSAGRYLLCVASGEAGMGLVSMLAAWEMYYTCGFAIGFWNSVMLALTMVFALFGYCTVRFRETKAMTLGQFLEIRYSRGFRIYAAFLQTISGIINYAIFPAVSARAMMYFLDLPVSFSVLGIQFSTFGLLMIIILSMAMWIVWMGGQISIMVTDCIQGLLSYPLYAIMVGYILYRFSWSGEMVPTLLDRPAGESLLNPYDIKNLRDFNLFFIIVGLVSSIINRMSWQGQSGYKGAAKTPHEQKMSGLLATWREGFSNMMYVLLAIAAFTFINHADFKEGSGYIQGQLTKKVVAEVAQDVRYAEVSQEIDDFIENNGVASPALQARLQNPEVQKRFADANVTLDLSKPVDPKQYKAVAQAAVSTVDPKGSQTIGTIYQQELVPVTLREILPVGITGALCALMIFMMLSTDTTYLHSWGSIVVQDIVLPFRKTPFTPKGQINLLRYISAAVAAFAFVFSYYFSQIDFIYMFFSITGAMWLGGAGSCIVFGLYWKRGTTAGAFTALTVGLVLAVGGMVCQQTWIKHLYPYLNDAGLLPGLANFLDIITRPFQPYIVWKVAADKFPINSREILFLAIMFSMLSYIVVSLLTCRKPFNMDRMLHRGAYADGPVAPPIPWNFKTVFIKLVGIDQNYTKSDRVLAWSVFLWSFGWSFGICFLGIVIWNIFQPWPNEWWAIKFSVTALVVPGIVGVVTTVWFSLGGSMDLVRLFRDLAAKRENALDDGRVSGNVSLADTVNAGDDSKE